MNQSVILVEHNTNMKMLKNLNLSQKSIITLDFVAHKNLTDEKIKHKLIEDYFNSDDEDRIDDLIIDKSTNWHKESTISELLEFEDINLGWLMDQLFFSYMALVIKKFIGIIRLVEKESFERIYCSRSVSKMIQSITTNVKISDLSTNSEDDLHYENVEIPLKIGGKLIHLRISKKIALMVKKIMESSTGILVDSMQKQKKTRKRILLLDFNIVAYEDLLTEVSKHFEIILLNERKPVIWNLHSLRITRKLKCKIIHLKDFENVSTRMEIDHALELLEQNMDKLFKNNDYFERFFSVLDVTFWPAIKHNLSKTLNLRFRDAIKRFILAKKLFTDHSIDQILLLYPNAFEEKTILTAAKTGQIPTTILEHGYIPRPEFMKKYQPLYPIGFEPGHRQALWGSRSHGIFSQLGIQDKNLIITGSPRHDRFFRIPKTPARNIVFFDSSIDDSSFRAFDTRDVAKNMETIGKICKKLYSLPLYNFSAKLHPGQHTLPYSIADVIRQIDAKIPLYHMENSADLLSGCALAVASGPSTVLLEAMIMDIPTIAYMSDDSWDEEDMFTSGSSILVHSYEDFEYNLSKLLDDEKFKNDLISKGNNFVKKCFSFPEKSSKNTAEFLNQNHIY